MRTNQLLRDRDNQASYGKQVLAWAEAATRYFSSANWKHDSRGWRCLDKHPAPEAIDLSCDEAAFFFDFAPLRDRLLLDRKRTALKEVRQRLFKIGTELMREATAADRRMLRALKAQQKRAEGAADA